MTAYTKSQIIERLNDRIEMAQHQLEEFQKKFAEDPYYAFDWGDNAMKAAAELRVFQSVKAKLEMDTDLTEEAHIAAVRKLVEQEVMQRAYNVSHSTSPSRNVMEEFTRAAYAGLLYGFSPLFG